MTQVSVAQKYADPAVVRFWQALARQGLQQAEAEMIRRYLPPGGRLLDVGCGAGRAVRALSAQGYSVTGIDLSLPMLHAGRSLSAEMRLGGANLLALPFAGESFDGALMFFGALQHIPGHSARRRALAEMARVVRPGGRLILGLDNLAPGLLCYGYWTVRALAARRVADTPNPGENGADSTLWQRRTHPLLWHARGVLRTLRWRTLPAGFDAARRLLPALGKPGDLQVAQFSQPATPGKVYYHLYRPAELIADASGAGWRLLGWHAGRELSEGATWPPAVRGADKQLFFAFAR